METSEKEQLQVIKEIALSYDISFKNCSPIPIHIPKDQYSDKAEFHLSFLSSIATLKEKDDRLPQETAELNLNLAQLSSGLLECVLPSKNREKTKADFTFTIKKGHFKKKITISNKNHDSYKYLTFLNLFTSTMLRELSGIAYQEYLGIPNIQRRLGQNDDDVIFNGFITNYTPEEIEKIIKLEQFNIKFWDYLYYDRMGVKIRDTIIHFKEKNIFDSTSKTLKTKEACFLYDTIVYLKIIPKDETMNAQDKYQFIKKYYLIGDKTMKNIEKLKRLSFS